jgi:hypothetical protein
VSGDDLSSIFDRLAMVLSQNQVAAVLIGGFALHFHQVDRETTDIDLLVGDADFEKLAQGLRQLGYSQGPHNKVFARFESTQAMTIDLLFVDATTLKQIVASGSTVKVGASDFVVPSLEHLLSLKLHAIRQNPKVREAIDLPDIIRLVRANHVDTRGSEFRSLCLRFASEEIYNRILDQT